jgi:2-polyprenyl-6-methoxyphenol hydroxylase-like FAD-dependent oxidoreductase
MYSHALALEGTELISSQALMPVCVVVGPGPVGKAVGQMLQELNVDLQLLDCDRAEFMEDKQLRSLMLVTFATFLL